MLQVAPVLQLVWQPPPIGFLQSTLQVVLAAHAVLQPPPGQTTAQGCDGEPQANSQVPGLDRSALGVQEQLEPAHEHCVSGYSVVHVTTSAVPPPAPPPPCPPCEVVPPRLVLMELPPCPPREVSPPRPVLVELLVAPPDTPPVPGVPPVAMAPPVAPAEPSLTTDVAPPVLPPSIDCVTPPAPRLPPSVPMSPPRPPVPPGGFWIGLFPHPIARDAASVPHIARTKTSARIGCLR
jgi:hypothetical protein